MNTLSNEMNQLLERYLKEILEINKRINLTRVTDYNEARLLHLEDSLSILDEIQSAPDGRYLDIGSGGGFPGVPLGIATGRKTTLIDSVKKKMTAVSEVIELLGLTEKIDTIGNRIEEYSTEQPESFSVITARAVSSIPALLELSSPLLQMDGHLILMKSKEKETFNIDAASTKLGMEQIAFREYYLSDNETYRCVYTFKKVNKPSVQLPRRVGMAQKRPLAS